MKRTITKEFSWDCAHRLYNPLLPNDMNRQIFGKCVNMHGHTYKMFVTISAIGDKLKSGMIINFTDLKEFVNNTVVGRFDHTVLNDDPLYKERLTTCENQVEDIWNMLAHGFTEMGCQLEEIKLYETPTSFATLTR